ncbi:ATP-dependent DNA helicase PIF1-like protein [Tanacetum coccineum]|uniref:ATP-dependent DNA helicase PIF1-like protein n=1 Tax=Tanacetum coccineum TaxID=301880 RepID=A0ABQ5GIK5_9ASTR
MFFYLNLLNWDYDDAIVISDDDEDMRAPIVTNFTENQVVVLGRKRSYTLTDESESESDEDSWFLDFLLRVGDGAEEVIDGNYVRKPNDMVIPYIYEVTSKDALIGEIFPSLATNAHSSVDITSRAILSTKNEHVDNSND